MHVAKRMAVLAMMAALSMVLILLGTVIPVNTLYDWNRCSFIGKSPGQRVFCSLPESGFFLKS